MSVRGVVLVGVVPAAEVDEPGVGQLWQRRFGMSNGEANRNLNWLDIKLLDTTEIGEAVGVLSRGMRHNPGHIAAFGENPQRRLHRFFNGAFAVMSYQQLQEVQRCWWWARSDRVPRRRMLLIRRAATERG